MFDRNRQAKPHVPRQAGGRTFTSSPSRAFLSAVVLLATACAASAFNIASFGEARAAIVTGKDPSPVVKRMSVELTNYLDRIVVGAKFPISERPVGGKNTIRLGAPYAGKMDEFAIFVNKKGELELTGTPPRGTVYAVYAFLEQLGCRFWAPDQETVPTAKQLAVPSGFKRVEAPVIAFRGLWGEGVLHQPWCSKLRLNCAMSCIHKEFGGETSFALGETLTLKYADAKKYFKDHPDWYALRHGGGGDKRDPAQLCMTSTGALEQVVADIRAELAKNTNATSVSVGPNDSEHFCQCERCEKFSRAHGGINGLGLHVANYVAKALAKDHPKVLVTTLAYWSPAPPKGLKGEPNVVAGVCEKINLYGYGLIEKNGWEDRFRQWSATAPAGVHVWNYYANFWNYLVPFCDYLDMGKNFRLYKKCGIRSVSTQMPWGPLSDMVDLRVYLYGRLLWEPDQDEDSLISDWIDGTCGKGAPFVKDYIKLQARIRATKPAQDFRHGATPADYIAAWSLICQALKATTDDEATHRRIEKIECGFFAEAMEAYREKGLDVAAQKAGVDLPTRQQMYDQLEALGKKIVAYKGSGDFMIAWKEGQWNFGTYLDIQKKKIDAEH